MMMTTTNKKRKTLRQGGPVLRKGISSYGSFGEGYWDSLKWKAVDVSGENLGDFGDRSANCHYDSHQWSLYAEYAPYYIVCF